MHTATRKSASTRFALALMSLLVAVVFGDPVLAQTDPVSAQTTSNTRKATYLFNFARYVTGTTGADGDYVIGVLGENTCGDALTKLAATKTVHGKAIRIRELASLADYDACDIIFVSGAASPELLAAVIRQTDQQRVLVVGGTPGFCQLGGTVNLLLSDDGQPRIEINIEAISRHHLVVDAKLMKLAKIVRASAQNGL